MKFLRIILNLFLIGSLAISTFVAHAQITEEQKLEFDRISKIIDDSKKSAARLNDEINELQDVVNSSTATEEEKIIAQAGIEHRTRAKNYDEEEIKKYQGSTIYRAGKINEDYTKRIENNLKRGEELTKVSCKDETEYPECFNLALKMQANKEYDSYLKAKRDYDICQALINRNIETDAKCKQQQDKMNAAAGTLRTTVNEMVENETNRNKEATFNVSEFFTLNDEPSEPKSITSVANTIADWMLTLVGSLAVTALIIGGFMMIISAGDEGRLETGKTIFTSALIGLSVTLLAYAIVSTIQALFYS